MTSNERGKCVSAQAHGFNGVGGDVSPEMPYSESQSSRVWVITGVDVDIGRTDSLNGLPGIRGVISTRSVEDPCSRAYFGGSSFEVVRGLICNYVWVIDN